MEELSRGSQKKEKLKEGIEYPVIDNIVDANDLIKTILSRGNTVIGIDIEAAVEMSRFGIICLLQIAFNDQAYIFDMTKMDNKELNLKDLFSNENVIKIFHDCIEDLSLLNNLCNITEMNKIFDTQIAHRMISEEEYKLYNYNYSYNSYQSNANSSISLAALIKKYLNIEYEIKGEMHSLMKINPYLWKTRPLVGKLNFYAGSDVIYLPKIYDIFCEKCKCYKNFTIDNIFVETQKYLGYVNINLQIRNFNKMNIQSNSIIQGLIKNYQKSCVFIQLNIGCVGIVINEKTIDYLKENYKLGDIIYFSVVRFDKESNRYILDLNFNQEGQENDKNNKIFSNSNSNKIKKLNVCVKSFYPKSYLINKLENENINNNINLNNHKVYEGDILKNNTENNNVFQI